VQVASTSDEKLNQPLLQFHKESTADMPLLAVNFDPALVRLLRETRYFLLLRIEVTIQLLHIVMWGVACCWMFPTQHTIMLLGHTCICIVMPAVTAVQQMTYHAASKCLYTNKRLAPHLH
jgi:hypothetical protein